MQIGSNPFVGTLHRSEANLRKKEKRDAKKSIYSVSYILDLSSNALGILKLFNKENDYYPIFNEDVFAYKKNLDLEYKPFI